MLLLLLFLWFLLDHMSFVIFLLLLMHELFFNGLQIFLRSTKSLNQRVVTLFQESESFMKLVILQIQAVNFLFCFSLRKLSFLEILLVLRNSLLKFQRARFIPSVLFMDIIEFSNMLFRFFFKFNDQFLDLIFIFIKLFLHDNLLIADFFELAFIFLDNLPLFISILLQRFPIPFMLVH